MLVDQNVERVLLASFQASDRLNIVDRLERGSSVFTSTELITGEFLSRLTTRTHQDRIIYNLDPHTPLWTFRRFSSSSSLNPPSPHLSSKAVKLASNVEQYVETNRLQDI